MKIKNVLFLAILQVLLVSADCNGQQAEAPRAAERPFDHKLTGEWSTVNWDRQPENAVTALFLGLLDDGALYLMTGDKVKDTQGNLGMMEVMDAKWQVSVQDDLRQISASNGSRRLIIRPVDDPRRDLLEVEENGRKFTLQRLRRDVAFCRPDIFPESDLSEAHRGIINKVEFSIVSSIEDTVPYTRFWAPKLKFNNGELDQQPPLLPDNFQYHISNVSVRALENKPGSGRNSFRLQMPEGQQFKMKSEQKLPSGQTGKKALVLPKYSGTPSGLPSRSLNNQQNQKTETPARRGREIASSPQLRSRQEGTAGQRSAATPQNNTQLIEVSPEEFSNCSEVVLSVK